MERASRSKLKVRSFSVSLDGYSAGLNQDLANPLGVGGSAVFEWFFATRTFHHMTGREGGAIGTDDDYAARGFENVGAWIMGRNMFGPVRGPWPDANWKGWWGENPPFHTPVFVLTHHPRSSIEMDAVRCFILLPTEFTLHSIEPAKRRAGKRFGWVVEWRPSGNIFKRE